MTTKKEENHQARTFSEALIVHGASAGWSSAESMTPEATETLLTALQLDGEDPLEVALVTQMIATHCQSIDLMSKAKGATHPDSVDQYLKHAIQMMNLYSKQTDVLMKYREKNKMIRIENS